MLKKIKGKWYRKTELDYRKLSDKALAVYGGYDDPGLMLLQGLDDDLYYVWYRNDRKPELIGDMDAVNSAIIEWFTESEADDITDKED